MDEGRKLIDGRLGPESGFSRAVFKVVRPHIPRGAWPPDAVPGVFRPAGDGLRLDASFEGLPAAYAALAARLVAGAGVELVLASPVAAKAARAFRVRRWRDAFLYAVVPLLFAIPLLGGLGDRAMRLTVIAFCVDVAALVAAHAALLGRRAELADTRFVAEIPAPGLRLKLEAPPAAAAPMATEQP